MRVLAVTNMWPRPDRPAFGTFVQSQMESVRALGVDVRVHVIPGDRGAAAYATHVPLVRAAVRRLQPDVVHAHFGLSGWTSRWQPAPLVVSYCGDDLLGAPAPGGGITAKSRVAIRMSLQAARRADGIICKSRNLVAALEREMDRHRAVVIPNGVDTALFRPGDRAAARQRLGLPPRTRLILFPHDPAQALQKRFDLAAAAIAELQKTRPEATLLHVSGVPPVEMPDYYRAADCLLLTSRTEGSPNVVKEALASGLPVVTVDVGDVRYWLERVTGCEIAAAEPAALAAAITRVLDRDAAVDPSPVLPDLDRMTAAKKLLGVYESVKGRKR